MDTTGCAFTFLVAKVLAGCKVGTYVHYPTISTVRIRLSIHCSVVLPSVQDDFIDIGYAIVSMGAQTIVQ
jgi:hypothetical protein